MIFRFQNAKNGCRINIDTRRMEQAEGDIRGKKYIVVSDEDYSAISEDLDLEEFACVDTLFRDALPD